MKQYTEKDVIEPSMVKCSCGGDWILYPLYRQCQDCHKNVDEPNGLTFLFEIQEELKSAQNA